MMPGDATSAENWKSCQSNHLFPVRSGSSRCLSPEKIYPTIATVRRREKISKRVKIAIQKKEGVGNLNIVLFEKKGLLETFKK